MGVPQASEVEDPFRWAAGCGGVHLAAREVHVRVGWQHSEFLTGPDDPVDLFALQLRAVFWLPGRDTGPASAGVL